MLTTILIAAFALLALLVLGKAAYSILGPRPYRRNDDDPFKIGSTAWSLYGPGSERWKENHGQRDP